MSGVVVILLGEDDLGFSRNSFLEWGCAFWRTDERKRMEWFRLKPQKGDN